MNDVIVIDGFKEIFLSMKVLSRNVELIRFLIGLKKNKIVNSSNVMSLELWTKMRAEVATQIAAQGKNKNWLNFWSSTSLSFTLPNCSIYTDNDNGIDNENE